MFEIIYCDVIFLYVKWFYYDCLSHYFSAPAVRPLHFTAFYIIWVLRTKVIPLLSRYTIVYFLSVNDLCYFFLIVIFYKKQLSYHQGATQSCIRILLAFLGMCHYTIGNLVMSLIVPAINYVKYLFSFHVISGKKIAALVLILCVFKWSLDSEL